MTKAKKTELDRCLNSALKTLDAHTKGLTQDLGSESSNLHDLISNQDDATQAHLAQLDTLIGDLKKDLSALRSDLTRAQSLVTELEVDLEETGDDASSGTNSAAEPSISAEDAAKIRHDEPVTLGTVIRSLLMANEPAQRERSKNF